MAWWFNAAMGRVIQLPLNCLRQNVYHCVPKFVAKSSQIFQQTLIGHFKHRSLVSQNIEYEPHAGNQMKRLLLALGVSAAMAAPVQADNTPVVVELFTSQGCSSCPPADEMMETLAARDDVIALSLHVDYWDYIGWKDEFADPGHAKRQRSYATVAGRRSIYTPEMIVNGVTDIIGAKPMDLAMAIEKHKEAPKAVSLQLSPGNSDAVLIEAEAMVDGLGPMDVVMLRYQPARVARITRGENAGRTIEYVNVAENWQVVSRWNGQSRLSIETPAPGDHPVVVLIQAENHGPIRGAARLVLSD